MGNTFSPKRKVANGGTSPNRSTVQSSSSSNIPPSNDGMDGIDDLDISTADEISSCIKSKFSPVNALGKCLIELSKKHENVIGISEKVFVAYLFPGKQELGSRLFNFLNTENLSKSQMSFATFRQQCENLLCTEKHSLLVEYYVKMFLNDAGDSIQPSGFKELLLISYNITVHHDQTSLEKSDQVIDSVVNSCLHGKDSLSISFVCNWLNQNLPLLVKSLHSYVVHILTTAYRNGECLNTLQSSESLGAAGENSQEMEKSPPLSHVWLLSMVLPKEYFQDVASQSNSSLQSLISKVSGGNVPHHWTILYDSDQHGLSWNRFTNHVLGYRGPTVIFIECEPDSNNKVPIYCVCSGVEWKESHLYYGDKNSIAIALTPTFKVLEHGQKMLYLNTSIRGYPHGLRAGMDPKRPVVDIDESFHSIKLEGVPYKLAGLRVWGCGDGKSRERQMELKKWELGEVQKQRVVKLSPAEWMEHPDRYLLEMAGHESYSHPEA